MGDLWRAHAKPDQEASKVGMRRDDQPFCTRASGYSRNIDPRWSASIPSMEIRAQFYLP